MTRFRTGRDAAARARRGRQPAPRGARGDRLGRLARRLLHRVRARQPRGAPAGRGALVRCAADADAPGRGVGLAPAPRALPLRF